MNNSSEFTGLNAGYVLDLYDRYRENPNSVDAATREFFARWTPPETATRNGHGTPGTVNVSATAAPVAAVVPDKLVAAVNLAHAIRAYGHLAANLDPLGNLPRGDPSLNLETHGLAEDDLRRLPATLVGGPIAAQSANALDAIQKLRQVYSASTGYDYHHVHIPAERDWLRSAAESGRYSLPNAPVDGMALLERLSQVEAFEHFLHRVFPGKTRFSLEGLDMVVPMLDEIMLAAFDAAVHHVLIGMAHRGRLNVLAHILGKSYAAILAEFRDPARAHNFRESMGWTGDVKYHAGAQREIEDGVRREGGMVPGPEAQGKNGLVISLPPNPSHVEASDPTVEGMTRAVQERLERAGAPRIDTAGALPILLHGDAAFSGQGIVAETLNFSRLKGYQTGGTIHIIENNQLGYTTDPEATRGTLYASDLAKGFEIPIVHVNADEPEACIEAARLAFAYRAEFHKDFLIDLIGYRRFGHNEGDEPTFTQPVTYRQIESHPSVRALWAKRLVDNGVIESGVPKQLQDKHMGELQRTLESLDPERDLVEPVPAPPPPKAAQRVHTAVPEERLRELNAALLQLPDDFTPNPKLERAMRRRRTMLDPGAEGKAGEPPIDWASAEELAFATILADGIPIRLTGEDVERGTFGQRHAVFHDVNNGKRYIPLQSFPQACAAFGVFDSPLSEAAALGFEYGYDIQKPECLVVWEAQYGDFVNGAQMIIDEFITSARAKWGQTPSLVLLLPHGWEGAGPDHSSGRLERFLELGAETNIRVANPTTSGQYFHLLRRQAALLRTDPLPLVVMTPKSLLRHPRAASTIRELSGGHWQPVLDDARAIQQSEQVRRLVLCSGKVYVDLVTSDERENDHYVALVRLEQLYPFPEAELEAVMQQYRNLAELVWLQEEPENMGAWTFVEPYLRTLISGRVPLRYIGRPRNASPAEGSLARHAANQRALIESAFKQ